MTDLNDLMYFDHVVYSDGERHVTDNWPDVSVAVLLQWRDQYAPQPFVDLDSEGQMISLDPADIHDLGDWTLLNGFSGQDGYSGPIMHESEYVGGGLERHIRENAGFYVVVEIVGFGPESDDEDTEMESVGWAVAYRALED